MLAHVNAHAALLTPPRQFTAAAFALATANGAPGGLQPICTAAQATPGDFPAGGNKCRLGITGLGATTEKQSGRCSTR